LPSWTIALFPCTLVLQFILMSGIAWLIAAGSVMFRDIPNVVGVALMILFYMTPVFYTLQAIPASFARILQLNPMTTIVEANRALLLGRPAPGWGYIAFVVVLSAVLSAAGYRLFRRLENRLVDEL
jgi:lipopolysaccharide transport system permease protein